MAKNLYAKICEIYIALLCILIVFPGFHGYETISDEKWAFYAVITAGFIAASTVLRLELAIMGETSLTKPINWLNKSSPVQKIALMYLIAAIVSSLLSEFRHEAFFGWERHEGLICIAMRVLSFLIICEYAKPKEWMLWVFSASMSINSAIALLQFAGYNPLHLFPEGVGFSDADVLYFGQYAGTSGNADLTSAMLSLSLPAFALAIFKLNGRRKLLLLIPLSLCGAAALRLFVTGGIIGIAAALIISWLLLRKNRKKYLVAMLVIAVILLSGIYLLGSSSADEWEAEYKYMNGGAGEVRKLTYEISRMMHGDFNEDFGSSRLYIWKKAFELVSERPLLGGGPDTFGVRSDAVFDRYSDAAGAVIRVRIDQAHNEYINILVNQGLAGLIIYLGLIFVLARIWILKIKEKPDKAILGAGACGYLIQAFFGISAAETTGILWAILALIGTEVEE